MPICKRDAPGGRLVRTQYTREEGVLYAPLLHPYGVSRAAHRALWLRGRGQGTLLRCHLPLHEEVAPQGPFGNKSYSKIALSPKAVFLFTFFKSNTPSLQNITDVFTDTL